MKKTNIIYWVFTVLLLLLMAPGAVMDIINGRDVVEFMHNHLGYPNYMAPFIGVAKLLGCIALLVPGFPRIKEWAYAGFIFDLSGAVYSSICSGDKVMQWAPLIVGFVIIGGSYFYHQKRLQAATAEK